MSFGSSYNSDEIMKFWNADARDFLFPDEDANDDDDDKDEKESGIADSDTSTDSDESGSSDEASDADSLDGTDDASIGDISPEKIKELVALEEWFAENRSLLGQPPVPPAPPAAPPSSEQIVNPINIGQYVPPTFPDDDDYEAQNQFLRNKILELDQGIFQMRAAYIQQQQQFTFNEIGEGIKAFQAEYNLSDEEVQKLEQIAVDARTLPVMVQNGTPVRIASQKSLEFALFSDPETREKYFQAKSQKIADKTASSQERKSKLGQLSSKSSTPVTPTEPDITKMSQSEYLASMAQVIADQTGL